MTSRRRWLYVRNWTTWQTYRNDRGSPPWIKVYRRLLQDIDWSSLTDAEKGQLVSVWILAADRGGYVPDDPVALQRVLGLESPPDLNKFKELQFLEPVERHDDVTVTSERRQSDRPEAETEEGQKPPLHIASDDAEQTDDDRPSDDDQSRPARRDDRFEAFWSVYPKRRNKKQAREQWKKKRLDEHADTIIDDVCRRQIEDAQWLDGYIPEPQRFLRDERWTDDYRPLANARSSPAERPSPQRKAREYLEQQGLI